MTSSVRTGWRRSNGSMVRRSLVSSCVTPSSVVIGPTSLSSSSKAVGQSSSAPSRSPMRCVRVVEDEVASASADCC